MNESLNLLPMKRQDFDLRPFHPVGPHLDLKLRGSLARCGPILTVRYELCGSLAAVALPAPSGPPARRHGLWEETCFEFFLAGQGAPQYWEFNLSPAGPWNVYHFAGYRQGMQEEAAFTSLPFAVRYGADSLQVALEVDLAGIVRGGQVLEAACAAVIKLQEGGATYWALEHAGPRPDFHRREGFSLEL
jgi:hypothetical protein